MNQLPPFTRENLKSHRAVFASTRLNNFVDAAIVDIYNEVIQMAIETNKRVYEYEIQDEEMTSEKNCNVLLMKVMKTFPDFGSTAVISPEGKHVIRVAW